MATMYPCLLCGKPCRGKYCISCRPQAVTLQHIQRIEAEFNRPIGNILKDLYVEKSLGTPEICSTLKIQFRQLRILLNYCEIPMKSMHEAVKAQWARDDGTRSTKTSLIFTEINSRHDITGENNPAKSPEARAKISAAKRLDNPGLIHLKMINMRIMNQRIMVCANCGKRIIIRRCEAKARRFCSVECFHLYSGRTSIEILMAQALMKNGIPFVEQYRVGRYVLDFALPQYRIAIECDGLHWHNPAHDAIRDQRLLDKGWLTFRYSDTQIKSSIETCVEDLITRLNILGIDPTA